MSFRKHSGNLAEVDFSEIDDLLSKLTAEELEQLNSEVDPDDSYLPARERCKEQTKKAPTGKYDREKLLKYLEDQAKSEKDWETKPYVKETRGKVWQPPPPASTSSSHEEDSHGVTTEWDDLLANASETEIVELAAILGFTGLVNQVQFHAANTIGAISSTTGGWNSAAKAEQLKFVPPEPDNQTDVDASIEKIKSNDSTLTQLNLNNIKVSELVKLQVCKYLPSTNITIKSLLGLFTHLFFYLFLEYII